MAFFFKKRENGQKYSSAEYSYDVYFHKLLDNLQSQRCAKCADEYLLAESRKGPLEMVNNSYVLFRYGEYYILSCLAHFGEKIVKDHEIVNNLHLTIFPRLIEYFVMDGNFYIITKIPHNKGKNIADCPSYIPNIDNTSDVTKRTAMEELKKLEKNGFVLLPTFRFCVRINDDGKIMIPEFELRTLDEATEMSILGDVYARYSMFGQ